MIRLLKFARPFTGIILITFVLLFVQAIAELSLPRYTANIVNVGIQQGGVEDAVPLVIRASQMDRLLLFMTADEADEVLAAFDLVTPDSPDATELQDSYPLVSEAALYVLRDDADTDEINLLMAESFLVVAALQQGFIAAENGPSTAGLLAEAAPVIAEVESFDALAELPQSERLAIQDEVLTIAGNLNEDDLIQSAAVAIRDEYAVIGLDLTSVQNDYILGIGGIMLAISAIAAAAIVGVSFLAARTAAGIARDIRRALFAHVSRFSNNEYDRFSVSSLITRTTNDVTQIQTFVSVFIQLVVFAPILGIGGIIVAIQTAPSMWWTIALAAVTVLSVVLTILRFVVPRYEVLQELIDRLNLVSRENLSGAMVIRAFNTQSFEEKRFDKVNQDVTDTNLFIVRTLAALRPSIMLIMNAATVLIIWVGAGQVADLSLQVGDLIAFLQYAIQVVGAFLIMSFVLILLPRSVVSARRIADALDTMPTIQDPQKPRALPAQDQRRIEFDGVSFRYPGAEADVLTDITFTAEPGTTTALIGSTGAGKSTIVNLIPRFYDVSEGVIRIDGIDIRNLTQADLRSVIGYVPQQSLLFTGTIDSNLRYADAEAAPERIEQATDIAQATKFIEQKDDGLQTEISQGGTNVSGGQRQRLAIARALVKDAPIYVFDDSFSALDLRTDKALRQALAENLGGRTIVLVTQRIATAKDADQIIVLEKGRIVGKGTHDQLLQSNDIYREIADSQLGSDSEGKAS